MQRWYVLSSLFVLLPLLGCDYESPARTAKVEKPVPPSTKPGPVDADAPEEFSTTESGLKYRIRRRSDREKADPKKMLRMHYRCWLDDGSLVETSYGTATYPATIDLKTPFPLGRAEGAQLVGLGGMIELEVPSNLGYGKASSELIPANSTLHYLIEPLEVVDPPKAPEKPPTDLPGKGNRVSPGAVDADAPEEFTTTSSGLKYRIRRKSDGPKPTIANSVTVHYKGWLDDGSQFDASYDRGEPISFALTGVIKGWTEGMQLIGKGGMIEFEIPNELGYGPSGKPPVIPPAATLHFIVELLDIK